MKLVWCPDTASKAYMDTVKSCVLFKESSAAEVVSAMAGGWNPQLIVETWYQGGAVTTSVGLALASRHTGGRHVCIVPNKQTGADYTEMVRQACGISPEVIIGEVEEMMGELAGIDFLVVDGRQKEFAKVLRLAKLSHRGAVLVCKNSNPRSHSSFQWRSVVDGSSRIVRSAYIPVGKGLEIAYVATGRPVLSPEKTGSRWVRHIDQVSGEEHVYRR